MWSVYILQSLKDSDFYVGISENIPARLKTHNAGKVRSTKARRPFKLVFTEACQDRKTARLKEKYYKTSSGKRFAGLSFR